MDCRLREHGALDSDAVVGRAPDRHRPDQARVADGADALDDVEEAAVSRLQSLELVEQRGVSFGLTLIGVRKVAQLKRS
jgi:hypothetical protein